MQYHRFPLSALCAALVSALPCAARALAADAAAAASVPEALPAVVVRASADASAQGLPKAYPGGQVARGGRVGILGNQNLMDTPFSTTAYTNELIQNQQARSVGDVLLNDPSVRVARGFGNFQESYFIRGFLLSSDNVAYNGLYGLLPRQYIAAELFERVELLRGASAFLTGANPGGDGIGGSINLLPKRAPNEPLTQLSLGVASGGQKLLTADVARRFGPDQSTGVRVVASRRDGGTGVDGESAELGLVSVGLDWRSRDARLSADIGYQDNRLKQTRTNVTLGTATSVPAAPDGSSNWAQPWSYSNERDTFGTLRGELDLSRDVTAYAAVGLRRSEEANSLANLTLSNGATGAGTVYRFDNTRKDSVNTGEAGLRGTLRTGSIKHEWVASASYFELEKKNAYVMDFGNKLATSLYAPLSYAQPAYSAGALRGNDLANPALNGRARMTSIALGDTVSLLDERLRVTLGARHQKLDITSYAYNTFTPTSYERSRTSPMAGAVFKLSPQLSVFANYIEGLTQGDTAPLTATSPFKDPPDNRGQALPPYVSKQKEVGLKYDGGRVGAGVTLFSTAKPQKMVNAANVFTSEGEDRHRGIELTVFGEAMRGLRVLGGVSFIDAEQVATQNGTTNGKKVIGVPSRQANLGVEWDVPGVSGLALDTRLIATASVYADAANTLRLPGWTRLDAGARYFTEIGGQLVTLRARVNNLTDRSYWASSGGFPGQGYLVLGTPRTVSVSASVDF